MGRSKLVVVTSWLLWIGSPPFGHALSRCSVEKNAVIPVPSRVEGSTEAPVSAFAESTGAEWRNPFKSRFIDLPVAISK